ncbi:MAG: glycoside hydrolase family 5 protein, partial [Acidimicrobiales bacterium]
MSQPVSHTRRRLWPAARRAVAQLGAVAIVSSVLLGATDGTAKASPGLSIAISGNHFVNGSGQTVRLLGVDAPGTEYACEQGWGYAAQPLTAASAQAIASWRADAVRVPLNEDCWL